MENEEKNQKGGSNMLVVAGSIIIAGIIIALSVVYAFGTKDQTKPTEGDNNVKISGLDIGEAPVLGEKDAPNTIVEFADFQCPYCIIFHKQMDEQLKDSFIKTGKAKMVFKTLSFIDSYDGNKDPNESLGAALSGECAKEQGKFWPMHDAVLDEEFKELEAKKQSENNGNLTREFFVSKAKEIGLDVEKFSSCLDSKKYKSQIDSYMNDADAAMNGEISTPSLYVNGVKISNPFDIKEFEKAMNK